MAEALVPKVGGDGGGEAVTGWDEGVEIAGGVTSEKHHLGGQILNRKMVRIKFNRNRIVASKSTNRNEIFNERRGDENVKER